MDTLCLRLCGLRVAQYGYWEMQQWQWFCCCLCIPSIINDDDDDDESYCTVQVIELGDVELTYSNKYFLIL